MSFDGTFGGQDEGENLKSTGSRENVLRHAVRKWFGPADTFDPKVRQSDLARQDEMLQLLFSLHRISCKIVPESRRLPINEQDIASAITVLNRLRVCTPGAVADIVAYCETRAARERYLRQNQLDPLLLRHLLTFNENLPHGELGAGEIADLRTACETGDNASILKAFKKLQAKAKLLPKDTPQFLRELAVDVWSSGQYAFVTTYAKELAVLDCAMLGGLGWENSRLFYSLMKRLHGALFALSEYMDAAEIAQTIEQYRQLGAVDTVTHFRALTTVFDPIRLRRIERATLSAPHEKATRPRNDSVMASPVERKKAVSSPPFFVAPEYSAQKK